MNFRPAWAQGAASRPRHNCADGDTATGARRPTAATFAKENTTALAPRKQQRRGGTATLRRESRIQRNDDAAASRPPQEPWRFTAAMAPEKR